MIETESNDILMAFLDALLDPVAVADAAGRLVAVNPALQDLLGYGAREVCGLDLVTLMPRHCRRKQVRQLQNCLRGEKVIAAPCELQHRNGRSIGVLLTLSPFGKDKGAEPLVIIAFKELAFADRSRDAVDLVQKGNLQSREKALAQTVTALEAEARERRVVEDQLRRSQQQLRMLSQKTLELLESDRQLIARELHDSIGASLAAIKFSLEGWLDVYGDRLPSPEIPFESIIDHIVATIKETKRISGSLRPTTLDDLGLLATARWFCRDLAGLYRGIRVTPRFAVSEADIPEAFKIVLYRVMQEALSNAAKHSGAEEIRMELDMVNEHLEMTIADEGEGFDMDRVVGTDAISGFGINSMRERIEICNGTFDLRTRIGEGTRIRVLLPVASQATIH